MKHKRDRLQWSRGNKFCRSIQILSRAIFQLCDVATPHAALFLCHPDNFRALRLPWFLFYIMRAYAAKLLLSRRAYHRLLSPGNFPIAHCAWAEDRIVIQLTMGSVLLGRRRKLMFLPFNAHPLIPPSTSFRFKPCGCFDGMFSNRSHSWQCDNELFWK